MKKYIWTCLVVAILGCTLFSAHSLWAENTAPAYEPGITEKVSLWMDKKLGKKTVKPYHQKIHQNGTNCALCHGAENPTKAADDANCLKCHGTREQVAQLTAELEPNPHDSPHYGFDVPCSTCHMEHKPAEIYCSSCHAFKYDNFKK